MQSGIELDLMRGLQQFRTAYLDGFFQFLNLLDSRQFHLLLIVALWQGYSRRAGLALFYILFINLFVNTELKHLFARIRPYHIDPSLEVLSASGYSMPSGAAQTYMLLACLLIAYWKNSWRWSVAILSVALISLSRVYLGVHYPTDILAGWFVGLLLFLVVFSTLPAIEKFLDKCSRIQLFFISQAFPLAFFMAQNSSSVNLVCLVAMGIGFGLFFNSFGQVALFQARLLERVLRVIWAIFGVLVYICLIRLLPSSAAYNSYFLLGLWLGLLGDFFSRLLFKTV